MGERKELSGVVPRKGTWIETLILFFKSSITPGVVLMDDFDENIDRKMNVNQQMSHLKHLELKSLLFQKITEIHKYNIPFHLEIFKPVREIPVEATDLVRIVGY